MSDLQVISPQHLDEQLKHVEERFSLRDPDMQKGDRQYEKRIHMIPATITIKSKEERGLDEFGGRQH